MSPLISVCILTYNQKPYIAQMLDSVLMQKTDFPFEVLIHDDASTDGTADVIRDYALRFPDVILPLFEEENQFSKSEIKNISGIYNFPRVRGKYIAMLEGDDFWTDPEKLQRQADLMEAHPECSLCFHSAVRINESTGAKSLMRPYRGDRRVDPDEIIDKTSGYPTASLMLRADLMKELPDFYMKAPIGDIPMQLTMAAGGYGYYFDTPMCAYRYLSAGSWTREMYTSADRQERQKQYARQMTEMYDGFDDWSGRRFHEETESAKRRLVFGTAVNLRDYPVIYAPENRRYLKEMRLIDRVWLRVQQLLSGRSL